MASVGIASSVPSTESPVWVHLAGGSHSRIAGVRAARSSGQSRASCYVGELCTYCMATSADASSAGSISTWTGRSGGETSFCCVSSGGGPQPEIHVPHAIIRTENRTTCTSIGCHHDRPIVSTRTRTIRESKWHEWVSHRRVSDRIDVSTEVLNRILFLSSDKNFLGVDKFDR